MKSPFNRRDFLTRIGGGFAAIALTELLCRDEFAADAPAKFKDGVHHLAKAKRGVIQLFMTGGASPMDTFDYKPALAKYHGQKLGPKEKPEGFTAMPGAIMKSPFEFKQHGQCGRWVSSVFPRQAKLVDELAFLMAMTTNTNVHGPATYMMNNGFLLPGFPCIGAWVSYGLGKLTDNLPTFVVLPDAKGLPYNQQGTFSAGFLPAVHQGTIINADARSRSPTCSRRSASSSLRAPPTARASHCWKSSTATIAPSIPAIRVWRGVSPVMNWPRKCSSAHPEAFDLSRETETTRKAYGLDNKVTADFGRMFVTHRLIERGGASCKCGVDRRAPPATGTITPISRPNCRRWPPAWTSRSQPCYKI